MRIHPHTTIPWVYACAMAVLALSVASPAAADPYPRLGMYCAPAGYGVPITVRAGGHVGIDGLDCSTSTYSRGRIRSPKCFANGGSIVTLDEPLTLRRDGSLLFNDTVYRYIGQGKTFADCP